ncbi:MAG: S24 family peptidase [bacterium]
MDMGSCSSRDIFALQVLDDTMEPEFKKDAVIVIDPEGHVQHESFVIAKVHKQWVFRQLFIENGIFTLRALKEGEKEHIISGIDEIEGVITQQTGRRRKDRKFYPPKEVTG